MMQKHAERTAAPDGLQLRFRPRGEQTVINKCVDQLAQLLSRTMTNPTIAITRIKFPLRSNLSGVADVVQIIR